MQSAVGEFGRCEFDACLIFFGGNLKFWKVVSVALP